MSNPSREAEQNAALCSFCQQEFGQVAKFIPDCGRLICLRCYERLMDDHAQSRRFTCRACGEFHTLPESGYPNCNQPPRLVKVEKALPPQAKELQTVVKHVREGLDKLHQFDAKEHVEQECERLKLEVSEAAERATKQIDQWERGLFKQIDDYRQRCLGALTADEPSSQFGKLQASINRTKSRLDALTKEIDEFSDKWTEYFRELSVYAREKEIEDALGRGQDFEARIERLGKELRENALTGSVMQFKPTSQSDLETLLLLGKLEEISTSSSRGELDL